MTLGNPADDPALLDRLSHLVSTLEEERRRLAGRLTEIEEELSRLEGLAELRNQIAHGFVSPVTDTLFISPNAMQFMFDLARRLVQEAQVEKQPA